MTRLIDANKLKMYIDTCQFCEKCPNIAFMCQRSCELPDCLTSQWERAIDEQPTLDAVPVRHGKWIHYYDIEEGRALKCSECKTVFWVGNGKEGNFCPNCGARMDEE